MGKKLVFAVVIVFFGIVILGVLEAGVRIVQWTPPSENMNMDNLNYNRYAHWPGGLGNLYPNQSGYWIPWKHRPYHVQTNSLGLRNTEEPRPGAIRILNTQDKLAAVFARKHEIEQPNVGGSYVGIPSGRWRDSNPHGHERSLYHAGGLVRASVAWLAG